MHAVFITSNKRYFDPASVERQFLLMLSEVYSTLHTVVLTRPGYAIEQVNDHTWLYPTNTYLPGMRYFDALYMVRKQVAWGGQLYADVIISDDPFVSGWVGLKLASAYDRAWLVHVHDFYWKRPLSKRLFRWPVLPLSAVLEGATRICVFSNRAQIYLESAANENQKEKLRPMPEVYVQGQQTTQSIDLKAQYPEYNFILTAYVPRSTRVLDALMGTLALLRLRYPKAGLVLFSSGKDERRCIRSAREYQQEPWVHYLQVEPNTFPFTHANVFFYLNASEEEDLIIIRAAAASCPILARTSPISQKIIEDRVNGLFVADRQPRTLSDAVRTFNEMPGWRERFHVNASMYVENLAVPSHERMVELLRAAGTFPYETHPPLPPKPEHELFSNLTQTPTLWERVQSFLKSKSTKGPPKRPQL